MPTKHNKIRYKATPKPTHPIVLTGRVMLIHRDDEELQRAKRGDVRLNPSCKDLHETYLGLYDATGFEGYFKVDVWGGSDWMPVILQSIFPDREHYFNKHTCPIDVANIIIPMLEALAGRELHRTYREHYELVESDA